MLARARRSQRPAIIAAAFLAFLPLIVCAALWVQSELGKAQREIEAYLGNQASTLSEHIDAEVEHQLVALKTLTAFPFSQTGDEFGAAAERLTGVMRDWLSLGLLDARSGHVISATGSYLAEGLDAGTLAAIRETRRPQIRPMQSNASGRTDSVNLFVPVIRDNMVSAILATSLNAKTLEAAASQQSDRTNLLTAVLDQQGRPIAQSAAARERLGESFDREVGQISSGRESGIFNWSGPRSEPMFSSFVRSPLTGWISVVGMPQRQIDKLSTRSVWTTIAAGLLSLILAGVLVVFIVHTMMQRRVAAERLTASRALGELDARLLATTQEALGEQRKASSEREVLLREIYHRVKNNLQIVQSLLRLGSRDLKPEQREPFESAVRRIGAMARVHTLLYESPDLASIDFKDYLEELLRELSEGFAAEERQIASILDAVSMRVPLDTAVPLAFIAVEILTNSFRHAFPGGRTGRISVEIRHDEPFGTLKITDDGVGLSDETGSRRRLGLTIVRKLVQQIGGHIEEPEPGSSTYLIRFPLQIGASPGMPPLAKPALARA